VAVWGGLLDARSRQKVTLVVDLGILAQSDIALAGAVVYCVVAEDVRKMRKQACIHSGNQEAVSEILQFLVKILAVLPLDHHSHSCEHRAVVEEPWDVNERAARLEVLVDRSHTDAVMIVADIPNGRIAMRSQEVLRAQTLALQPMRTWSPLPALPSLPDRFPNVLLQLRATASASLSRPFPTCPF